MDHHHHHHHQSQPPPPDQQQQQQQQEFSYDISQMSELPSKPIIGHRRAHSEILGLPDDMSFDSDLGVVGNGGDTEEELFSMFMDMGNFGGGGNANANANANAIAIASTSSSSGGGPSTSARPPEATMVVNDRPNKIRHHHSQSMDGSSSMKPELGNFVENKKAISSAKLADLALVDPKRAKRIWANRQSAARSKERKMRYISELEKKVQELHTEATTLSTQLILLQRDAGGINAENHELKLRLSAMEQQVGLQDALNDTLRDEVQHLKILTGQNTVGAGSMMNFGPSHGPGQAFYPNNQNQAMRLLAGQQFQQLQIQQSNQLLQQQQQVQHQQAVPSPGQRESSSDFNPTANN